MLVVYLIKKIKKNGRERRGWPRRLLCACACSLLKNKKNGREPRSRPARLLGRSAQKLQFSGVRHVALQPGCCVVLLVHWVFSLVYCRKVRGASGALLGVSACACALNIKIKNKTPTTISCRDLKGCVI